MDTHLIHFISIVFSVYNHAHNVAHQLIIVHNVMIFNILYKMEIAYVKMDG